MSARLDTCRACDAGRHGDCDGTVAVMEQDGVQRYVCRCHHRRETLERQRRALAESKVRRYIVEQGLSNTHELVRKAPRAAADGDEQP